MATQVGKAVIYGIQMRRPIMHIPEGCKRIRVRLRADDLAKAIVVFDDRIEVWVVVPTGNKLNAPTWELGWMIGGTVKGYPDSKGETSENP